MAVAFEYGARVRLTERGIEKRGESKRDWEGEVVCYCSPHTVRWDQNGCTSDHEDWELTTNLTPMATLKEKFVLSFKQEPEKSFIKAGILNMDSSFTSEGKEVFLEWMLKQNQDLFKTQVADPILADMDNDK